MLSTCPCTAACRAHTAYEAAVCSMPFGQLPSSVHSWIQPGCCSLGCLNSCQDVPQEAIRHAGFIVSMLLGQTDAPPCTISKALKCGDSTCSPDPVHSAAPIQLTPMSIRLTAASFTNAHCRMYTGVAGGMIRDCCIHITRLRRAALPSDSKTGGL